MTIRQVDGKKQRILRQLPCELCDINILTICRIQHLGDVAQAFTGSLASRFVHLETQSSD